MRPRSQRCGRGATNRCSQPQRSRSARAAKRNDISVDCAAASALRRCRCARCVATTSAPRRWPQWGAVWNAGSPIMAIDRAALDALLRQRLIVCVGAGGVGKTTTAAALGVAAALHGCPTAVITVDPSRRLKDALGLSELSNRPRRVALGNGAARLDALALDTKRTFDELIVRFAPSPAVA